MMPQAFFNSGLAAAVNDFTEKIDVKNLTVSVSTEGNETSIEEGKQIMAYRIIQECVQNVLKHANATRINISIIYTNCDIDITVEDNGTGFPIDTTLEGVGIKNIRSRVEYLNGKMTIESNPGLGTAFTFYMPAKESKFIV
jgi:signal transduction histidine kinase